MDACIEQQAEQLAGVIDKLACLARRSVTCCSPSCSQTKLGVPTETAITKSTCMPAWLSPEECNVLFAVVLPCQSKQRDCNDYDGMTA